MKFAVSSVAQIAPVEVPQLHEMENLADGSPHSACSNCQKKDSSKESCSLNFADSIVPRLPVLALQKALPAVTGSNTQSVLPLEPRPTDRLVEQTTSVPASHGSVTSVGDINAAVATRLGPASAERPSLIATTDVPFFGAVLRDPSTGTSAQPGGHILPLRKDADHLLEIYWEYIHPLEPLVYKESFLRSYHRLFSGNLPKRDQDIFLSTLNAIFAISTQSQASLNPKVRDQTSETYFHRAWDLLRPERLIWEPGNLDTVQCLLLVSRYLQCTNNPHRTWMVVGLAVRMAQSLGLDIDDHNASQVTTDGSSLRQHIWQCCVFMDRLVILLESLTQLIEDAQLTRTQKPFVGLCSSFDSLLVHLNNSESTRPR